MSLRSRAPALLRLLARAAQQQQPQRTTAAAVALGRRAYADDANLKRTVLYDLHVKNGGERGSTIAPRPLFAPPSPSTTNPAH